MKRHMYIMKQKLAYTKAVCAKHALSPFYDGAIFNGLMIRNQRPFHRLVSTT